MMNLIQIDRGQCLQQQLYDQLQILIGSGRLANGTRMPSTRMLAEQFGVSRNTALLTYERLIAEGLLETRPAQGTFVVQPQTAPARPGLAVVSDNSTALADSTPLLVWRPDPGLFPLVRWRALMRNAIDSMGSGAGRRHPGGEPALRQAVAAWLSSSRGICVAPDQVILAESRQQALHIACHLTVRPGASVLLEDPCEAMTEATFEDQQAQITRIAVDFEGMCVDRLPRGGATLVHVSPEHQRPLGAHLAAHRRLALLSWAERTGTMVLEDDCQGELHYGTRPAPPLASLDQSGRVMMIGSFAPTLGPCVRMAYLVVPAAMAPAALAACQMTGGGPSRLEQIALAALMEDGWYARHVHRVAKIYATRRNAMVSALRRHLGEPPVIWGEQAGLHLAWFAPIAHGPAPLIARTARLCGLEATALPDAHRRTGHSARAVILGFGTLSETQIDQRINRLATTLAGAARHAQAAD